MTAQIERVDGRVAVSGNMTLSVAKMLLSNGSALVGTGDAVFDLAKVGSIDSSGLAVLFGWQRAAQSQNKALQILNPPRSLVSLAEVYGVSGLLTLS